MGGGAPTAATPAPVEDPEEDEYERAKAEYLKCIFSFFNNVTHIPLVMNGSTSEPEPVPEPAAQETVPEEEDDYEKMKAEYESKIPSSCFKS